MNLTGLLRVAFEILDTATAECLYGYYGRQSGWIEYSRRQLAAGSVVYYLRHLQDDLGAVKLTMRSASDTWLEV
jgi:hypothetical protein